MPRLLQKLPSSTFNSFFEPLFPPSDGFVLLSAIFQFGLKIMPSTRAFFQRLFANSWFIKYYEFEKLEFFSYKISANLPWIADKMVITLKNAFLRPKFRFFLSIGELYRYKNVVQQFFVFKFWIPGRWTLQGCSSHLWVRKWDCR